MRVFVMGGTGLIGTRLLGRLRERGDSVMLLTRRPAGARARFGGDCTIVEGNPMQTGRWMDEVTGCDAVINLVGESIFARRWNEEFKVLLRESRVKSTANVVQALAKNSRTAAGTPRVLVNASAIGYYGPHGDEELTETGPPGDDLLARLTVDWEQAARGAEAAGVRVAIVRVGVVLDKAGGALGQMLTPFKLGIGGPVASGKQWLSWIHHEDIVGILLQALDHAGAAGPINGTAPNPVTNKAFSKALGRALHRPAFLPIPAFGMRLRFGEVAEILTTGQRVLPRRALELGYSFHFPEIDGALASVLSGSAAETQNV
jgi:uncharacterized protein (TIGR01777 family)